MMLQIVEWHRARGDHLVLLSCSNEFLVKPFDQALKMDDFFGLTLKSKDGILTGEIEGITDGLKKLELIIHYCHQKKVDLTNVYLYTDAIADGDVLKIVGHPCPTYPDKYLRKLAQENHWPILDTPESFKNAQADKILLLSASSGGGHHAIAKEIQRFLHNSTSYDPVIIPLEQESILGKYMNQLYNYLAENKPEFYEFYHEILNNKVMRNKQKLFDFLINKVVHQLISKYEPVAIIAVHAFGAEMLTSFKKIQPNLPAIVYVSDWFGNCLLGWGNPSADLIYSPSERNKTYLCEKLKLPAEKIVVGAPIFQPPRHMTSEEIKLQKEALNLHPQFKTVLMFTGGSEDALPLLDALNHFNTTLQVIVLCHRNQSLFEKCRLLSNNIHPILWSNQMDKLYPLVDVVFTKPGPSTIIEALANKKYIFINHLKAIMPQEKEIAAFVLQNNLGQDIVYVEDWIYWLQRFVEGDITDINQLELENGLDNFCSLFTKLITNKDRT